jgi:methionyl aminopeptidase
VGAPLNPDILECLRTAGRIAAAVREEGASLLRPGVKLRDVCESLEDQIRRRGGTPAFPVQSSLNAVAAHYCPAPDDDTAYAQGDVAKLDIGVHVDGWVVDTAVTVAVGGDPAGQRLVDAARAALEMAVAAVRPGVPVHRVSSAIESALRGRGLVPMRNLCGHGVGRYTVHTPPPIPNVAEPTRDVLAEGAVVAIEPFVTDGSGTSLERGRAEVFRLVRDDGPVAGARADVLEGIRAFRGLPFSRRQLRAFVGPPLEETLSALAGAGRLAAYPPLVEASGRPVAQAEHTVYVGVAGVEVLTR